MKSHHSLIKTIFLLFIVSFNVSCAVKMYSENMLVRNRDLIFEQGEKSAYVKIEVSRDVTNYQEKVLNNHVDTIQEAFHQSLTSSGLLRVKSPDSDYIINMEITKCKQPSLGLNYPTEMEVNYSVFEDKNIVFNTQVSGRHVMDLSEAFSARKRARMSIENAIKESNEEFIRQFSIYLNAN